MSDIHEILRRIAAKIYDGDNDAYAVAGAINETLDEIEREQQPGPPEPVFEGRCDAAYLEKRINTGKPVGLEGRTYRLSRPMNINRKGAQIHGIRAES